MLPPSDIAAPSLQRPNRVIRSMISNWTIHCDYHEPALAGCSATVPLHQLQKHVDACAFSPAATSSRHSQPIRTISATSSVSDVLQASPSKMCGDVADRLTSKLVTAKAESGQLEVKPICRGRPQIYQRVTAATTSSEEASLQTIRRRSLQLSTVNETVCGDSAGIRAQEVAGIKCLSTPEQEQLLHDIGLHPTMPTSGTALAIKADLSLSYRKFRMLRTWLRSLGVQLESEKKMRAFIATQMPAYTLQNIPMTRRNGELRMAAMVYFPDLIALVLYFLDKLHGAEALTWSSSIPQSEVWIKIGGDHGGGTFKLSFQVSG